jgi:hypothetical protein
MDRESLDYLGGDSWDLELGLRCVLGIVQVGVTMGLSNEDREAILKLWDYSQPKASARERKAAHARIENKFNNIYYKNVVPEVTIPEATVEPSNRPRNAKFEALDDTCGIAIGAFLDPARRRDNPMFDVQPITLEFLDRLELEHRKNSVWSM